MSRAPSRRSTSRSMRPRSISPTRSSVRSPTPTAFRFRPRPAADGIVRRIEVRAREAGNQLGGVRARQQQRRADRPPDRRAALPHGRLRPVLARPRALAHRQHHAEFGRPAGPAGFAERRHLPHHARSRHRHHLRGRAAHRQAAAALSVGARRLQGQGQLLHALPRHRHRHRRPARAVPHHPVRRQGQRDVSRPRPRSAGRCSSISAPTSDSGARCSTSPPAPSASGAPRARRSSRRRWSCSCLPTSISIAGTCATPTSRPAGSCSSARSRRSRCSIPRSPRASRASRSRWSRSAASGSSSISRPTASTARCC